MADCIGGVCVLATSFNKHTHVTNELEYLFSPYSVFLVTRVQWARTPDDPHTIELLAAIDNRRESKDLLLAPWY